MQTPCVRAIDLQQEVSVTASYSSGGSSCPSLFMWNGTTNSYVSDISNHGWLGYINYINHDGSINFYRNNPWITFRLTAVNLLPPTATTT